jgi:hypothetical protein
MIGPKPNPISAQEIIARHNRLARPAPTTAVLPFWTVLFSWIVRRTARKCCRLFGHTIGPLRVGPKYAVGGAALFDLYQRCARCGAIGVVVPSVLYSWKAYQALTNALSAVRVALPKGRGT